MKRLKGVLSVLLTLCIILSTAVAVSAGNSVVINTDGSETVQSADSITIDGAKVTLTLDNASVGSTGNAISIINNSAVTLELVGDSTVCGDASAVSCGIYVEAGSSLTVKGGGTLTVTGGKYGAAIGSYGTELNLPEDERIKCGDITIAGGTIYAYGGSRAAAIGSGNHVNGGNITVSGGTVYAFGSDGGAGIGSGYGTSGGAAPVAAVGDYDAGHISISGGTVYAAAFKMDFSKFDYMNPATYDDDAANGITVPDTFAAGIGGGYGASAGDISISGGKVIAVGSCGGAGIGSGRGTSKGSKYDADAFKVNISISGNAEVIAVATDDNRGGTSQGGGAAIGSGRGTHTGGKIDIFGNANVVAVAPPGTYAIGSGSSKNPVNGSYPVSQRITVSDGVTLYAVARGISAVENTAAEFSCGDTIGYDNALTSQTAFLGTREYTVPVNTTSIWANKGEAVTPPSPEDSEKLSIRIDTPKRMAVKFGDGTVYYGGEMKEVAVGEEYTFQMCSVNWENGIYDEDGNGLCGTVVYRMKVVHAKEFIELRKKALNDPSRYTVKGIDIIDNESKMIIINCDTSDFHLETDVNNFFVAYRFHFENGDYNKQTGIKNVVDNPLESLSVNLPLGTTVRCDAYKGYQYIDSADVLVSRNSGEGVYADELLTSVNDYYWNY
ncbi:MAG: hypothetical protein PUC29_08560 [Clostridia bacterium]|nr:hypothetical protein [Clostridia bacterium]